MKMVRVRLLVFQFSFLVLWSCSNSDEPVESIQDLYCNYSLSAEEDGEQVVLKMVFTRDKASGKTLNIEEFGQVELDGEVVQPDSARRGGVYYEIIRPMAGFEGRHTISLKGKTGKVLAEEFEFRPFSLADLSNFSQGQAIELRLINPPPDDQDLQLIMIDTSFSSGDINESIAIQNGSLKVGPDLLRNLRPGPIIMEIHQEETRPLKERTRAGGHFTFFYTLRRELEMLP